MICRNCGFHNAPGDAFCGSCGQFLGWNAEQPGGQPTTGSATDETVVQPPSGSGQTTPPSGTGRTTAPAGQTPAFDAHSTADVPRVNRAARHSARPQRGDAAQRVDANPRMARSTGAGVSYGAIACWNCGRRNPASRSFCQQCGERLSVATAGGYERRPPDRGRLLAVAAGVLAALLLVGGAAALFLGGAAPVAPPSPTEFALATGSPPPLPTGLVVPTTALATAAPTALPSPSPTLAPVTPPPPTPASCASSTVPTQWVNLSGGNTSERVRRNEIWCIHEVVIVPDPNFGFGTIRFRANDEVLAQVTHDASSSRTEYAFDFSPAVLVAGRQNVVYRMNCAGELCNAVIQVGYELLSNP